MDVLINKQYKSYDKLSRYNNLPYYYNVLDNRYVYSTGHNLKDTTPYKVHTVQRNDTLDSISLAYYKNPTYFWIIADFNRIRDPFESLTEGTQIKVPSFSMIEFED